MFFILHVLKKTGDNGAHIFGAQASSALRANWWVMPTTLDLSRTNLNSDDEDGVSVPVSANRFGWRQWASTYCLASSSNNSSSCSSWCYQYAWEKNAPFLYSQLPVRQLLWMQFAPFWFSSPHAWGKDSISANNQELRNLKYNNIKNLIFLVSAFLNFGTSQDFFITELHVFFENCTYLIFSAILSHFRTLIEYRTKRTG